MPSLVWAAFPLHEMREAGATSLSAYANANMKSPDHDGKSVRDEDEPLSLPFLYLFLKKSLCFPPRCPRRPLALIGSIQRFPCVALASVFACVLLGCAVCVLLGCAVCVFVPTGTSKVIVLGCFHGGVMSGSRGFAAGDGGNGEDGDGGFAS